MKKIAVFLTAIFFATCITPLWAQETATRSSFLPKSESPDKTLALFFDKDQNKIKELSLISLKGNSVNVSFPLSDTVKSWNANHVQVSSIIWTEDSSAVALMISDGENGEVYVCGKMTNSLFKAVNFTQVVEGTHLGVLGRPATDFARSEHQPMRWGEWSAEYGRIILVRSRFWDKRHQRYTINSPYLFMNDGEIGSQ
jgi:hypothetical protein